MDGFQGREKGVVVFSCVRAGGARGGAAARQGRGVTVTRVPGIGFLADVRRMNVALTRGKYALWVVGDSTSLVSGGPGAVARASPHALRFVRQTKNDDWRALVRDAQERRALQCVREAGAGEYTFRNER